MSKQEFQIMVTVECEGDKTFLKALASSFAKEFIAKIPPYTNDGGVFGNQTAKVIGWRFKGERAK